jgi:hypothetical protein
VGAHDHPALGPAHPRSSLDRRASRAHRPALARLCARRQEFTLVIGLIASPTNIRANLGVAALRAVRETVSLAIPIPVRRLIAKTAWASPKFTRRSRIYSRVG